SAFAFAVRAARDAFQTRHGLSPRPCGSPGEVARLSTVFDAVKPSPLAKGAYQYLLRLNALLI
ncbi:hypothetical protein MRP05_21380, partial [Dickeya dianthicola]|nr:hypothetical protein [Dickeya dianthicola]